MADSVRYRVNGDNSRLRSVLHDLWKYKCYWCHKPKDFNDIQIDHIIPQTVQDERLQHLVTQFDLAADFDLHDPRNLAPICSSCNGPEGKGSDDDLIESPIVLSRLRKAEKLRSTVIESVQTFATRGRTAKALIQTKEADLSDPATRQAFEEYAPAVVQKLALLDEAKVDFVSVRTIEVELDDHLHPDLGVSIALRAMERRAVTILEDVCGGVVEDLVSEPVIDLFHQIHARVQGDFEAINDQPEPITAGPPVSDFTRFDIESIAFERSGPFFEFTFGGDFEATLSASLVRYSNDGSDLLELQGDAFVTGKYSFVATWDSSKDGEVEAGDCSINSWDCDKTMSAMV